MNLQVEEKGSVGKRVAANTGMMVGAKGLAAVIGLFSLIIVTKNLDIRDVGIILFLHAYMLFFAEVATFQSWQAVIRFGTKDVEENNSSALLRLLRFCMALDFVGAIAAFVFAVLGLFFLEWLLPLLPSFSHAENLTDIPQIVQYGIPYCLLILVHQGGASTGIFRLFDKFAPLAAQVLVMPVFRLLGALVAWAIGGGIESFLLAWFVGSFIGYISLPLFAAFELKRRRLLRPLFSHWPSLKTNRKGIWPFVWKANIDASLATGTTHLPLMLVMPIFGPAYVGMYKVAEEIAKLLSEGVLLLDRVIYPEYARLIARGRKDHIWRIVSKAALILFAIGIGLSAIVAMFGPWAITHLFGPDYHGAVVLAILLMLAASIMGVSAPLYPVFYAAGQPEKAVLARTLSIGIYIALVFGLSAWLGQSGPGWAAIIANMISVTFAAYLVGRVLKAGPNGT